MYIVDTHIKIRRHRNVTQEELELIYMQLKYSIMWRCVCVCISVHK